MPSTNFLQVNPNCNNQESDSAYASDSQRSGGMAVDSIFASNLANKILYQLTTWVTAMANMLVAKGYSPNDGNASPSTALANLESVLANLLTNADRPIYLATLISTGVAPTASLTIPAGVVAPGQTLRISAGVRCTVSPSSGSTSPVIQVGGTTVTGGSNIFNIYAANDFAKISIDLTVPASGPPQAYRSMSGLSNGAATLSPGTVAGPSVATLEAGFTVAMSMSSIASGSYTIDYLMMEIL